MLAGDTLVTISLAGSLFFSITPAGRREQGPALPAADRRAVRGRLPAPRTRDRREPARAAADRRLVGGAGRVVLCILMAASLHSLWLFPEAFCVLVLSKLYLVTRGALVPEMAAADQLTANEGVDEAGWPSGEQRPDVAEGFAGFNAQLTLLGTLAGFAISLPGIGLLKAFNAETVLVFASLVFIVAAVCAARLRISKADARERRGGAQRRGGRRARPAALRGPRGRPRSDRERDGAAVGGLPHVPHRLRAPPRPRRARVVRVRLRRLGRGGAHRPLPRAPAPAQALRAVAARLGTRAARASGRPRRPTSARSSPRSALCVRRRRRRCDLPALLRRAHPAPRACARPGTRLRPVRGPPAARVGPRRADPRRHRDALRRRRLDPRGDRRRSVSWASLVGRLVVNRAG